MSDAPPLEHPAEIRALCDEAVAAFRALASAEPGARGALVPGIRDLLVRIDAAVEEADLRHPDFAREQGWLVDASSALQSIDLDRGGPHVPRFVERAVADLRRVAGP